MRRDLRIVLLGPGEGERYEGFDTYQKRLEILELLQAHGYPQTVMGENIIPDGTTIPLPFALVGELKTDDLVLVLDTGAAPLAEITAILFARLDLRDSTHVFCPRDYLSGERSTPGDIVRSFVHIRFNTEELTSCELTTEFIAAANRTCFDRAQRQGEFRWFGHQP